MTATSSWWRWISDPNHKRTLGFIGAFIVALAAGGCFSAASKPTSPTSVSVGNGDIARNVTTTAEPGASNKKAAEAAYQLGQLAYERDYAKAYEYFQNAAKLEPDNPTYLNMAGRLAYEVGRYAEARPLLEDALALWEKALGPEHPHVATGLNSLAQLYRAQGQYGKAEPLYQRALQILQQTLPPHHPNLAQVMENYSALLGKLNRPEEAKEWQAKAIDARQQHAEKDRDAQ